MCYVPVLQILRHGDFRRYVASCVCRADDCDLALLTVEVSR
jgi:hypothetical protein